MNVVRKISHYDAYITLIGSVHRQRNGVRDIGKNPVSLSTSFQPVFMAALRSRCGHYILPCDFYLSSSSFFPRLISAVGDWMSTILPHIHRIHRRQHAFTNENWCGLSANLECMETCCTRLAEIQDAKMTQKIAIYAPSHNFLGLNLRNKGMYRQSEKLVKQ